MSETDVKKALNREAVDFIYDERRKKYVKVLVEYNLQSKEAKVKKFETIGDSKPTALHKGKEWVVNKIFFSNIENPQALKEVDEVFAEATETVEEKTNE